MSNASHLSSDEQVRLWVKGESRCPNDRGECCPDFSCCADKVSTPTPERARFAKALRDGDDATRERMCMGFLGAAIDTLGADVHIAGTGDA